MLKDGYCCLFEFKSRGATLPNKLKWYLKSVRKANLPFSHVIKFPKCVTTHIGMIPFDAYAEIFLFCYDRFFVRFAAILATAEVHQAHFLHHFRHYSKQTPFWFRIVEGNLWTSFPSLLRSFRDTRALASQNFGKFLGQYNCV